MIVERWPRIFGSRMDIDVLLINIIYISITQADPVRVSIGMHSSAQTRFPKALLDRLVESWQQPRI